MKTEQLLLLRDLLVNELGRYYGRFRIHFILILFIIDFRIILILLIIITIVLIKTHITYGVLSGLINRWSYFLSTRGPWFVLLISHLLINTIDVVFFRNSCWSSVAAIYIWIEIKIVLVIVIVRSIECRQLLTLITLTHLNEWWTICCN